MECVVTHLLNYFSIKFKSLYIFFNFFYSSIVFLLNNIAIYLLTTEIK